MLINIKATKMEMTPAIESFVMEKIGSLEKYFDNIIGVEVEVGLTSGHHNKGDIFRAEINLEVPKKVLRAEVETDDLYKSITAAKDVMKNEMIKYKETLRGD